MSLLPISFLANPGVWLRASATTAALVLASPAFATAQTVEHSPATQVFGEPGGTTMREPEVVRQGETVEIWFRVSYSFDYQNVALYYTTDGTTPLGNGGTPQGNTTTQTLTNNAGISFIRNEFDPGANRNRDWWKATIPAVQAGQTVKYKISAFGNGPEVYTNGANVNALANIYEYTAKLPWPGAGAGAGAPALGYPGVSFWKEEAVFGNTYTAGQIDQNGAVYDFHFPTPGGVYGVGTKNEGYVDGLDTFPAGLPIGWRGQMHLNQAMPGIRVDGTTHWLSNPNGVSYDQVTQAYLPTSNTIRTTQRLNANGNNIAVEQYDFAPMGVAWPTDGNGTPQHHIYLKRMLLTNNGPTKTVDIYWYIDPAINGGDTYDGMYVDTTRGAMIAYDNTGRTVTGTGTGFSPPNEYNPTTSGGYDKQKSLFIANAMKVLTTSGTIESTATDFWRDTSGDNSQGWMAARVTLPTGVTREVCFLMAGANDDFAGATGTYDFKLANVVQWFYTNNTSTLQAATDSYWTNWLNTGTTVNTPDSDVNKVMTRGLLTTALHVDGVNGGVIAGFHNGAYPYVWPRDAVYAAITLARTGHLSEARNVYEWMKNTTYRDFEPWGRKGFWKQKYSTDGYVIWGAPQIDETAVFPWGVKFQYDMTADAAMLNSYVEQVRDSVEIMTRDSSDSRLRYEEAFDLVYSNNVWEDSYDTFIYSNANIVRGLYDAASIFSTLGLNADATNATNKGNTVKSGLDARLDWNGENTDISQLGIAYPFNVYAYNDARVNRVADRINGITTDTFGNNHPLVNFSGEHTGTINRYWGDNYWNGGPWFLSTLWYGLYYGERQDLNPGSADIDNHYYRLNLSIDRLGPAGLGAEQIAFGTGGGASLMYPGQQDFKLQTAWPNAWESMSTLVDAVMKFADYTPDAANNRMILEPKLPTSWNFATFNRLRLVHTPSGSDHSVSLTVTRNGAGQTHTFTNHSGLPLNVRTTLREDPGSCVRYVRVNGAPTSAFTKEPISGRITVDTPLATGANATTVIDVVYFSFDSLDFNRDGNIEPLDVDSYFSILGEGPCLGDIGNGCNDLDFNNDGNIDPQDVDDYFFVLGEGQPACL